MPSGCEGSCPACRLGEVEDYKCGLCGREYCQVCHGLKSGTPTENVLPCSCFVQAGGSSGSFVSQEA